MDVVVTGIGLVSALGQGIEANWQALVAGQSAIATHQPFPDQVAYPMALVGQTPADPQPLLQATVSEALRDSELPPLFNNRDSENCGVVIGSSRSFQSRWEAASHRFAHDGNASSPELELDWMSSLPHTLAVSTAQQIGATGPVLAPMAACATGLWAISQGLELLQTLQCQRVIVGAVEAPITPLTLAGFRKMGALAQTGCYPFDQNREGLVLGEGAAVFVMEPAELAAQRSAPVYGKILGFGLTADGYHVSAPAPHPGHSLIAIKQCLEHSGLSPQDIDYIHAHGTSTQLNDCNEAQLIQNLFPTGVPVSSTKGATGHTLGASGALGTAFCLLALKHQQVPPCTGLNVPEFDLNFVTQAHSATLRHTLCLSFGFGGQNAVVAIGPQTS